MAVGFFSLWTQFSRTFKQVLKLIPLQKNALDKLCLTSGRRALCWGLQTNELLLSHCNCIVTGKQESWVWAFFWKKKDLSPSLSFLGECPDHDQCCLEDRSQRASQEWPTFLSPVKSFKPWILGIFFQDIEISDTPSSGALSVLWVSPALQVYETLYPIFALWKLLPELGSAVPYWVWCSGTSGLQEQNDNNNICKLVTQWHEGNHTRIED